MIKPTIIKKNYPSGFKAEIILRPGFNRRFMGIIVDFGSSDDQPVPGLAHFLEHKLFAQESGDLSLEFEKLGSDVNAFTSFNETMYYASGVKNVAPTIDLLFDLVGKPYFTDENVKKEIPIIQQELAMYQDEPDWPLGDVLMRSVYGDSNLAIDVAGTKESIASVDKKKLQKAYDDNYLAGQMSFVACGDFSDNQVKTIFRQVGHLQETLIKPGRGLQAGKKVRNKRQPKEPLVLSGGSVPLFAVCLNLKNFKKVLDSQDLAQILLEIMLESKLGSASAWYAKMRRGQLLNQPLQINVTYTRQGNYAVIMGMSPDARKVISAIKEELAPKALFAASKLPAMREFFTLQKRVWLAQTVRSLNNIAGLAVELAEESLDDEDLFENVAKMQALNFDEYCKFCASLLDKAGFYSALIEVDDADEEKDENDEEED